MLLLRVVARNLIMWDEIGHEFDWIRTNLPPHYCGLKTDVKASFRLCMMPDTPSAGGLAFYNITAGLCWSIALKHAGTGNESAWETLCFYFDEIRPAVNTSYTTFDKSLARDTLMRFHHLLALGMATIMAGTGHLPTLQRLRTLHGAVEDKAFGYHQAAHTAIGILFLGQGRYSFSTSNLSIAALLCAFYPIFPKDVLDNRAHLQAFRHFWVFAAEARCLVLRDVETHTSIEARIRVVRHDGSEEELLAPCLLPELRFVQEVRTLAAEYWPVVLDFARNAAHLAAFKKHQTIFLRRKSLLAQHPSALASTFATMNEMQCGSSLGSFDWLFELPVFKKLGVTHVDAGEILPSVSGKEGHGSQTESTQTLADPKTTAVDDLMVLSQGLQYGHRQTQMLRELYDVIGLAQGLASMGIGERTAETPWLKGEWVAALRASMFDMQALASTQQFTEEDQAREEDDENAMIVD